MVPKKRRRDAESLGRVVITTTDKSIDELEKLAGFYNEDHSNTLSSIIDEFLNDKTLIEKFDTFFNGLYKKTEFEGIERSSIFKNYNIPKASIKKMDSIRGPIGRSAFIRALISFFTKFQIDEQDEKVKKVMMKLLDTHILIKDYALSKQGLFVLFDIDKKKK